MANCQSIDPLVTPYVDGELSSADRLQVDEHLQRCPPCYSRVAAEGAIRTLVHAQRRGLTSERASSGLRARCGGAAWSAAAARGAAGGASTRPAGARVWGAPLAPFALAASLVVLMGGAFVYEATDRSTLVMAAELAADHVKCFATNQVLGTHEPAADVERAMLAGFDWRLHLPDEMTRAGFELVGARRCLYGEGKVAHVMFRQQDRPVSVFMLPRSVRPEEIVEVLGQEAAIWSAGNRTYVLVTSGSRSEVQQMASVVRASFH
jgi:anti-sigma factor RsiW